MTLQDRIEYADRLIMTDIDLQKYFSKVTIFTITC